MVRLIGALFLSLTLLSTAAAQVSAESAVKGNLSGTVYDVSGAVLPGATVKLEGAQGVRTVSAGAQGEFFFALLVPGTYKLMVEAAGFRTTQVEALEILTNRTTSLRVALSPGAAVEVVEVRASALLVDTTSAAIGSNLTETFYSRVPVERNVASLFYFSAGVASGGGTGRANPSISGSSGLENLYVADGVSITDAAFGGLGVYGRRYGSLATGINLAFIQEVQVKTGSMEPQYGKATGGVIQIVTKSGSRDFHGSIAGYAAPKWMEATRLHADDCGICNQFGKMLNESAYDLAFELSGYVPGLRDRLFFFAAFNPTFYREHALAASSSMMFSRAEMTFRRTTWNYAAKATFKLNDNHVLESSLFGDPSHTSFSRVWPRGLAMNNETGYSRLQFGSRNWVVRYNGTLTPTWLLNGSFTWGSNYIRETDFADLYRIIDYTQSACLPGQRGLFGAVGLGEYEPTTSNTFGINLDTTKQFHAWGEHTLSLGYRGERPFYAGKWTVSGPLFSFPATNLDGDPVTALGVPAEAIGQQTDIVFSLRLAPGACTLCPFMTVPGYAAPRRVVLRSSGTFNAPFSFDTSGIYHAGYLQDSWSPWRRLTFNLGLRWERQTLRGQDVEYTFPHEWSPRLGVVFDPTGRRDTKLFFHFARYHYALPLDMAERGLTISAGGFGYAIWLPEYTGTAPNREVVLNQYGTVTPILDAGHLLNRAAGGVPRDISAGWVATPEEWGPGIAPGTRMQYQDEYVAGIEHRFPRDIIVSLRYVDRRLKRVVEDGAGLSPEAANVGIVQNYLITNIGPQTDLWVNEQPVAFVPAFLPSGAVDPASVPTQCLDVNGDGFYGEVVDTYNELIAPGAVCFPSVNTPNTQPWFDSVTGAPLDGVLFGGELGADGIPEGFPVAVRKYQALELEVNRAFSRNWQLRLNYRYSRLFGNYEGAYRNDNGQNDPSISSLFDFTTGVFNMLEDQLRPGLLNTDRKHVFNTYFSYVFDRRFLRGLTVGLGARVESGIPITRLKAHPVYMNSGELAVGGRGSLGRMPLTGSLDLHLDYVRRLNERFRLRAGMDLFNLLNHKKLTAINEFEDTQFGLPNADFLLPYSRNEAFQRPFHARMMLRLEF